MYVYILYNIVIIEPIRYTKYIIEVFKIKRQRIYSIDIHFIQQYFICNLHNKLYFLHLLFDFYALRFMQTHQLYIYINISNF